MEDLEKQEFTDLKETLAARVLQSKDAEDVKKHILNALEVIETKFPESHPYRYQ